MPWRRVPQTRVGGFGASAGGNRSCVSTRPLSDLRGIDVMVGDHHIGEVTGVILDPVEDTVLGFEVRSRGGRSYFLPLALSMLNQTTLTTASPLHLVDDVEYYRRRGRAIGWAGAGGCQVDWLSGRISASQPAA